MDVGIYQEDARGGAEGKESLLQRRFPWPLVALVPIQSKNSLCLKNDAIG